MSKLSLVDENNINKRRDSIKSYQSNFLMEINHKKILINVSYQYRNNTNN